MVPGFMDFSKMMGKHGKRGGPGSSEEMNGAPASGSFRAKKGQNAKIKKTKKSGKTLRKKGRKSTPAPN